MGWGSLVSSAKLISDYRMKSSLLVHWELCDSKHNDTEPATVAIRGYSGIQGCNYPIVTENRVYHRSIELSMMNE